MSTKHSAILKGALLWFLENEQIYFTRDLSDAKLAESLFVKESRREPGKVSLCDIQKNLLESSGFRPKDIFDELESNVGINYHQAISKVLMMLKKYDFSSDNGTVNFEYKNGQSPVRACGLSKSGLEAALKFQEHNDNQRIFNLQNTNTKEQIKISTKLKENSTRSFWLAISAVILSVITVSASLYRIYLLEEKILSHDDFEVRLNQLQVTADSLKSKNPPLQVVLKSSPQSLQVMTDELTIENESLNAKLSNTLNNSTTSVKAHIKPVYDGK